MLSPLVSCRKTSVGLSYRIMFFSILCFAGLFSPRTFHEISFMRNRGEDIYRTWSAWEFSEICQHFSNNDSPLQIGFVPSFFRVFQKKFTIKRTTFLNAEIFILLFSDQNSFKFFDIPWGNFTEVFLSTRCFQFE